MNRIVKDGAVQLSSFTAAEMNSFFPNVMLALAADDPNDGPNRFIAQSAHRHYVVCRLLQYLWNVYTELTHRRPRRSALCAGGDVWLDMDGFFKSCHEAYPDAWALWRARPKWHQLVHLPAQILRHGAATYFSTQEWEQTHQPLKREYRRSSKRDPAGASAELLSKLQYKAWICGLPSAISGLVATEKHAVSSFDLMRRRDAARLIVPADLHALQRLERTGDLEALWPELASVTSGPRDLLTGRHLGAFIVFAQRRGFFSRTLVDAGKDGLQWLPQSLDEVPRGDVVAVRGGAGQAYTGVLLRILRVVLPTAPGDLVAGAVDPPVGVRNAGTSFDEEMLVGVVRWLVNCEHGPHGGLSARVDGERKAPAFGQSVRVMRLGQLGCIDVTAIRRVCWSRVCSGYGEAGDDSVVQNWRICILDSDEV